MTYVLWLVLGTAVLHAGWNALAKSVGDRWVASTLIGVVNGLGGIVCILVFGLPDPGAWPFLVASPTASAFGSVPNRWPTSGGCSPFRRRS